jgi:hypothetical protein
MLDCRRSRAILAVCATVALYACVGPRLGEAPKPAAALVAHVGAAVPIGWFSAGGGWRAMSVGMAVARNLHKAGVLSRPEFTHAAANSGGAWFMTQFAYSQPFFNNVTSNVSMETLVADWLASHRSVVAPATPVDARAYFNGDDARAKRAMQALDRIYAFAAQLAPSSPAASSQLYQLAGFFSVVLKYRADWAAVIEALLTITDARLRDLPAIPESRTPGFGQPALHLQTCNATTATLTSDAGVPFQASALDGAGARIRERFLATPMQYVVPSLAAPTQSAGFVLAAGGVYAPRVAADDGSVAAPLGRPFDGADVKATFAAASSSAALGVMGSRAMIAAFFHDQFALDVSTLDGVSRAYTAVGRGSAAGGNGEGDSPLVAIDDLLTELGGPSGASCEGGDNTTAVVAHALCLLNAFPAELANFAVCDHARAGGGGGCAFPAERLMDGGFVDNLGAAQTVGAMQRTGAPALRLVLSANGECSGPPNMSAPLSASDGCSLYDLAALFAGGYVPDANGAISVSWGVTQPSPAVFAQQWRQIKFTHVKGSAPLDDAGVEKGGGAFVARIRTVTIANGVYGVAAGTPVDILLFACMMPVALMMGFVDASYPVLAQYAGALADSDELYHSIRDWLAGS